MNLEQHPLPRITRGPRVHPIFAPFFGKALFAIPFLLGLAGITPQLFDSAIPDDTAMMTNVIGCAVLSTGLYCWLRRYYLAQIIYGGYATILIILGAVVKWSKKGAILVSSFPLFDGTYFIAMGVAALILAGIVSWPLFRDWQAALRAAAAARPIIHSQPSNPR